MHKVKLHKNGFLSVTHENCDECSVIELQLEESWKKVVEVIDYFKTFELGKKTLERMVNQCTGGSIIPENNKLLEDLITTTCMPYVANVIMPALKIDAIGVFEAFRYRVEKEGC